MIVFVLRRFLMPSCCLLCVRELRCVHVHGEQFFSSLATLCVWGSLDGD
jgi:hypothetical protein